MVFFDYVREIMRLARRLDFAATNMFQQVVAIIPFGSRNFACFLSTIVGVTLVELRKVRRWGRSSDRQLRSWS